MHIYIYIYIYIYQQLLINQHNNMKIILFSYYWWVHAFYGGFHALERRFHTLEKGVSQFKKRGVYIYIYIYNVHFPLFFLILITVYCYGVIFMGLSRTSNCQTTEISKYNAHKDLILDKLHFLRLVKAG